MKIFTSFFIFLLIFHAGFASDLYPLSENKIQTNFDSNPLISIEKLNQTAPVITSVNPNTSSTPGGGTMTITGSNFGNPGDDVEVNIGSFVATNVQVISNTTIECTIPPGFGFALPVVVIKDAMTSNNNVTFSYNAPVISGISPSSGGTSGGTNITITGSNFGPAGTMASVTIGGIAATAVTVTGHTTLTCVSPAGVGTNLPVVVTVAGQNSNNNVTFSYNAPVISSLSPNSGNTSGGTNITITGSNFGPAGTMASVTIGGVAATAVTVTGHTTLTCVSPAGVGTNLPVVVTVAGQNSNNNVTFSYNAPVISGISPSSGSTFGGTNITITGSNFGPAGSMASVTIGGLAATAVTVTGHTTLTCVSPAGVGTNLPVVVTVTGQNSNNNITFSYYAPVISGISPSSGGTSGGTNITITGSNFGPAGTMASVTIGGLAATAVTVTGHTTLTCVNPAGVGTNLPVVVTVAGQNSNNNITFSYNAPVISSLSPNSGNTSGGTNVTITGSNFGPAGTMASVTFGGNAATMVTVTGHTTLTCVSPEGISANVPVVVTIAGQSSNNGSFSYNPPVISSITPNSGNTSGGTILTISGNNFGPFGTFAMVTIGGIPATMVTVGGHTSLSCITPPGVGTNLPVVVTVAGQNSNNNVTFSYNAPVISGISPNSGGTQGGTNITITGSNFGPAGTTASVTIGGIAATTVTVTGHTALTCVSPAGVGTNLPVVVTVAGQTSNNNVTFSYNGPSITGVTPLSSVPAGGGTMTITGSNFGPGGTPATVSIGSFVATNTMVNSHTNITCTIPPGSGTSLPVVVTISGQQSQGTFLFNYLPETNYVGVGTTEPQAALDVTSTVSGFLPPRMTKANRDAIINPVAGLMIWCNDCGSAGQIQVYNGQFWTDMIGGAPAGLNVGDSYGGGIVAYILQPGDPGYVSGTTKGFIAAPSDQGTASWGCHGTNLPGADGQALGTGAQNTIDIVNGCATNGIAARICADLVLNGYSDWYLPSRNELQKLYDNRVIIGGFGNDSYWSSSEASDTNAWYISFVNGFNNSIAKSFTFPGIRAIRSF